MAKRRRSDGTRAHNVLYLFKELICNLDCILINEFCFTVVNFCVPPSDSWPVGGISMSGGLVGADTPGGCGKSWNGCFAHPSGLASSTILTKKMVNNLPKRVAYGWPLWRRWTGEGGGIVVPRCLMKTAGLKIDDGKSKRDVWRIPLGSTLRIKNFGNFKNVLSRRVTLSSRPKREPFAFVRPHKKDPIFRFNYIKHLGTICWPDVWSVFNGEI